MAYSNEPDRRSAVSSFYGGRKSSLDALNTELRAPTPTGVASQRARHDDASSFFTPERTSADLLTGSAGYNRMSYFDAGREEPVKGGRDEEEDVGLGAGSAAGANDGWDVYADFNNAGPRYSTAFGKQEADYHQLPPEVPGTPMSKQEDERSFGPVEMVTVPALGAEWKRSELKDMTKSGRHEKKAEVRARKWKEWNRGQRGCCGRWGTRTQVVIVTFLVFVVIGITLAFTIPRVPTIQFTNSEPLLNSTLQPAPEFSRTPANFSFNANLDLQVDSTSTYVPLKFTHLTAQVFDLDTGAAVGTGDLSGNSVPARTFTEVLLPLNFTYVANNDTDQTWANWYNACKNSGLYANGQRPGLNFRIVLHMTILGLIGSHEASAGITNVNCPFQLSIDNA